MRKKNISVVMMWILIMSSMLIGCGNKPTASLLDGTYKIIENQEELLVPAVLFDTKEKEFQFSFDALSSYLNVGTYKINGDNVIATTDDGKYTYTFRIVDENTISYVADESDSLETVDGKTVVPDGAVFEYDDFFAEK